MDGENKEHRSVMFHWVSRVVDWRFIFGDVEKEEFVNEWRAPLFQVGRNFGRVIEK